MTHLFCIDYKFYFLFEICSLFDIFQIYPTIYKVDNIFQLLAILHNIYDIYKFDMLFYEIFLITSLIYHISHGYYVETTV